MSRGSENIVVAVRLRPLTAKERRTDIPTVVEANNNTITVSIPDKFDELPFTSFFGNICLQK